MRRIAAVFVVVALCAGVAAWALSEEARPAVAGGDTPTPTNTPIFTPTPALVFYQSTFTNASESPADALDVISGAASSIQVIDQPIGCGTPDIAPPVLLRFQTVFSFGSLFLTGPVLLRPIRWPTACVDVGAEVTVEFGVPQDQLSMVLFHGVPRSGVFFDSAIATVTPTPTPVTPSPTPSPTPTSTSTPFPAPGVSLLLDCDVNAAGIQSTCTVPLDAGVVDVDVVLVNNGPAFTLAAWDFTVQHPSIERLDAQPASPCSLPALDCNPDFAQGALTGVGWFCSGPGEYVGPDLEASRLTCGNAADPHPVSSGGSVTLAKVHYDIAAGAAEGGEHLVLIGTSINDDLGFEKHACNPGPQYCGGATITLGPPAPTPTPFPGPGISMVLDCDVNTAGIQSVCSVPLDAPVVEIDAVVFNNTGSDTTVAAFDVYPRHADDSRLNALSSACLPPGTDCNPDHDWASLGIVGWLCGPPYPNPDLDGSPGDRSFIGCFNGSVATAFPNGSSLRLARVRYAIPPGATVGAVSVNISLGDVYDEFAVESLACANAAPCFGATINLGPAAGITVTPTFTPSATMTPLPANTPQSASTPSVTPMSEQYLALDCALSIPGVQSDCTYLTSDSTIDIGFVLVANTAPVVDLAGFDLGIRNPDTTRLFPPAVPGSVMDGNPDADEAALNNVFGCAFPTNVDPGDGPSITTSELTPCTRIASDVGPAIAVGNSLRIAHVRYNVQPGATPGSVSLDSLRTYVIDEDSVIELFACPALSPTDPCAGATITLIDPPPAVVKVPEGVGDNVDLSVPKANLWICELGPCAGPGEGALRVVEHATDVLDGLGAYEFTVEYDNFVIASVNPCDIVFGPGGAGDDRGPVDEEDESAINPDCSPDPGPGGGTCSYSHILENVIHFGCVTAGQAPGPTGDMDLASLLLIPHEDLVNDLFPGNENGVLTVIKDNGCELVDILGHPVSGSINGGLVPTCGNLAVTVRILEGDLDLNCLVDVTDAQLIAGKYGAFFGSLLYSKWYDLEPALHDLDIDIKDIQKVFGRDGSNCQTPVPPQPPLDPPAPF